MLKTGRNRHREIYFAKSRDSGRKRCRLQLKALYFTIYLLLKLKQSKSGLYTLLVAKHKHATGTATAATEGIYVVKSQDTMAEDVVACSGRRGYTLPSTFHIKTIIKWPLLAIRCHGKDATGTTTAAAEGVYVVKSRDTMPEDALLYHLQSILKRSESDLYTPLAATRCDSDRKTPPAAEDT